MICKYWGSSHKDGVRLITSALKVGEGFVGILQYVDTSEHLVIVSWHFSHTTRLHYMHGGSMLAKLSQDLWTFSWPFRTVKS